MIQFLRQSLSKNTWLQSKPGIRLMFKQVYNFLHDPLDRGCPMKIGETRVRMPREYWTEVWSTYETAAVQHVSVWLKNVPGPCRFVDVGASHGFYSLLALESHADTEVWACDADAESLAAAWNFCRLADRNRLRLLLGFMSDSTKDVSDPLSAVAESKKRMSLSNRRGLIEFITYRDLLDPKDNNLPRYTLDRLFSGEDSSKINFLKVDVEGAELIVLKGALEWMKKARPQILVSVHPQFLPRFNSNAEDVRRFLELADYKIEWIGTDHEEHWWCTPLKPKAA